MSRWFRVYDEMLDDPKMQRLPPDTFRAVINLWCLASRSGGIIPAAEDVAFALRVTESNAVTLLDELVTLGFLDAENGVLKPHNWDKRQYKSDTADATNADRQRRFRERNRNGERNAVTAVTVTPPRTDTDTETEQIQKEKYIGRSQATRPPSDSDFEEFWKVYPKRAGTNPKAPALKKFKAAVRGGAVPAEITAGAARYADDMRKANKFGTEFVKQSMNWLSQRMWEDYRAASAQGPPSWRDEMHLIDEQLARAGNGKNTGNSRREGADNVVELRQEGGVTRCAAPKGWVR